MARVFLLGSGSCVLDTGKTLFCWIVDVVGLEENGPNKKQQQNGFMIHANIPFPPFPFNVRLFLFCLSLLSAGSHSNHIIQQDRRRTARRRNHE